MRTLSDTLARMASFKAQANPTQTMGGHSRLANLSFPGTNPGALGARCYVPENLPTGAALVVVLHGCTQSAAAYDHGSGWSQLAEREGFAVLYPEQQRANNPNLCFNWFEPADTQRDRGEALSIRQMIEAMIAEHAIDRTKVFVTGLSAGGAMTSTMLALYPEVFAGGAIIAGLPHGVARTVPEAFDRMRGHGGPAESQLQALIPSAPKRSTNWPRISVWHGTSDRTVVASNAADIVTQWRGPHHLPSRPTHTNSVKGHTHRVWCAANGSTLIEEYVIAGMVHGAPQSFGGPDRLGSAGPFMLEAGISSTRESARAWGLLGAQTAVAKHDPASASQAAPAEGASSGSRARPRPEPTAVQPTSSTSSYVGKVIEDALRAAGLMR